MDRLRSQPSDRQIKQMYLRLSSLWGNPHWWPAHSRFEVIVGAYLTQNTSWSNVELAMGNLRRARVLNVAGIRDIPIARLEILIRSSGYFRQKAARLKTFVKFLDETYHGSLTRMFAAPTQKVREQLLSLNGVGRETADSILLYAGQHPIFVVDAYTRRLATRHGIVSEHAAYDEARMAFQTALANVTPLGVDARSVSKMGACHSPSRMSSATRCGTAQVYNEMHGFIVGIGKQFCRKSDPDCAHCPLRDLLPAHS